MDAVRFGRALGFGARQAAKTVVRAVDAARAESPSHASNAVNACTATAPPPRTIPAPQRPASAPPPRTPRTNPPTQRAVSTPAHPQGLREGIGRFHASAVEPAVRLSAVLWLEIMGVFFGLFALACGSALWRLRAELRPALTHPFAHATVLVAAAICVLFAYFSLSSFVRAHRRQRRRA